MRGHIRRRGRKWVVVLELDRDPGTGRRRQRWLSGFGTRREAEDAKVKALAELQAGEDTAPDKTTLGEFLDRWLQDYAEANLRPRTIEEYRKIVVSHVRPALGGIQLAKLRPAHLQQYYAKALREGRKDGRGGLAAVTVLHHHRLISEALSHAIKWGLVSRNAAQGTTPPRAQRHEPRILDGDGIHWLLEAALVTPYYALIHLAVYTGLRRSELLGLRWRSVDLDMAMLSVVEAYHVLPGGKGAFLPPKTDHSRRVVTLSPTAVLALREHRASQYDLLGRLLTDDSLVFAQWDGRPLLPDTVSHAFGALVRKAGLPRVRFHDLRHSHASLMLRSKVHPKVVQERLGHSTITTTLDTYSHVTPGLQEDAAQRFEEGLKPKVTEHSPSG